MKLNTKKIRESKKTSIISTKDSLIDIIPIEWSKDILNGIKKIKIVKL